MIKKFTRKYRKIFTREFTSIYIILIKINRFVRIKNKINVFNKKLAPKIEKVNIDFYFTKNNHKMRSKMTDDNTCTLEHVCKTKDEYL